jgi:hypothetical protein
MLTLPGLCLEAEARQVRSTQTAQKSHGTAVARPVVRKAAAERKITRRHEQRARPSARPAAAPASREAVEHALLSAAQATGFSPDVLRRIAERESRLDPSAANRFSSARGLMQFTRDTWLEVVRDFGPRHGLGRQAEALITDRDGNIGTRNWRELQGILRLREDPHLAAVLAAERLLKAEPALEEAFGRRASPGDLYLVHMLGPTGARQFLSAVRETPGRSSVAVVGSAAKPNPGVFERGGRPLPVSKVYEEVAEMFDPRAPAISQPMPDRPSMIVAESER